MTGYIKSSSPHVTQTFKKRLQGYIKSYIKIPLANAPRIQYKKAIVHWERKSMDKTYLGDGCYASFDGFHVILTTEDGYKKTNEIFLDDRCREALELYFAKVDGRVKTVE